MKGKTVLLTGGTGGIGLESARALARLGARVTVTGRDAERGASAVEALRASTGNPDVSLLLGDLTTKAGVAALASAWLARGEPLDVLVHNAGLMASARQLTGDGLESGFAVNVAAPLWLTHGIEASLSERARVVALTGGDHPSTLELDNLQGERHFVALTQYSHHKLVMMATMRELARRWAATGRTVNVCYPGQASTAMTRGVTAGDLPRAVRFLFPVFKWMTRDDGGRSAQKASRSTVHLASSPAMEGRTGCYVDARVKERPWPRAIGEAERCAAAWARVLPLVGLEAGWAHQASPSGALSAP